MCHKIVIKIILVFLKNYRIENINFLGEIKKGKIYTAQIRYHGEFLSCTLSKLSEDIVEVIFKKPTLVASGQSIVVYDNEFVLLGGVVIYGIPYNNGITSNK